MSTPDTEPENTATGSPRKPPQRGFFGGLKDVAVEFGNESWAIIQFYDDVLRSVLPLGDYQKFNDYASLKKAAHNGEVWIVVHNGFLDSHPLAQSTNAEYDSDKYRQYMTNISDLLQSLNQTRKPTFLAMEDHEFQARGAKKDPPNSLTFSIITQNGAGNVKQFVYLSGGG